MSPRRLLPLTVIAGVRLAHALPPGHAPDYAATYQRTVIRKDVTPPKTIVETIRIAVAGTRARWEHQPGGQVTLYDLTKPPGSMTIIDPQLGGKLALKTALQGPMSNWDYGYANLAADGPAPVEAGATTIAGVACTRLRFTTKQFGNPELCVTSSGVVARFHLDDPEARAVTTFEATTITVGPQEPRQFAPPDGWAVQDMTAVPMFQ